MNLKKFFICSIFVLLTLVTVNNFVMASSPVKMIKPEVSEDLSFEDQNIKVSFNIKKEIISFKLENKLSKSIRLIWNDVSIILPSGSTSRVIKSGIRYMNKESNMAPATIPAGTNISDVAVPVDNIYYSNTDWKIRDLLDSNRAGTTFGIYLPLEIGDKTKSYDFRFELKEEISVSTNATNITGFGGASTPVYGTIKEQKIGDKVYTKSIKGINWGLGYTNRYYTGNGLAVESGSFYYEYGTLGIIFPYAGGGYSYKFNEAVIGSIGFPAYLECTFKF